MQSIMGVLSLCFPGWETAESVMMAAIPIGFLLGVGNEAAPWSPIPSGYSWKEKVELGTARTSLTLSARGAGREKASGRFGCRSLRQRPFPTVILDEVLAYLKCFIRWQI